MSNFENDILPSLLNSDAEVGLTTCNTDPGSILFCWHMNLMEKEEVDDDDDDIYIMMQCLSVTKNEHFLKRPVCLFVMFYPHFFQSRK